MAIDFYYSPMSSATRIHWALEELGIPYNKIKLDTAAGDQRKPEFLKLNPNGKVPTLVDDGAPLFESLAILLHLGEKYGVAKGLWPAAGTPEHAQALSWSTWGSVTLLSVGFRIMYNTSEHFPAELRHAPQAEQARKDLAGLLDLLESHLTGKQYTLGERFSLADVANASIVGFMQWALPVDLSPWPQVAAWSARCHERPAMQVARAG